MSAQPSVSASAEHVPVDWLAYFERVLPHDRALSPADLEALGYRSRWRYQLIEGSVYCTPRPGAPPLTWSDLASDLEWTHWVVELIEGMLVVTRSAPTLRHQECVGSLYLLLRRACTPDLETLLAPFEYASGAPFLVQPDILVASRPIDAHRLLHTPVLTVEVLSPTTQRRDRRLKQLAYERAGVPHYWLIEPEGPSIEALRLVNGEYRLESVVKAGEMFSVEEPVPVSFDPADLLDA
jgi:Uma2 family endonuclease